MIGCEKRPSVLNTYEVLLSNGDTMYVKANFYEVSPKNTYVFFKSGYEKVCSINIPIYVIKKE
jgi:hypothetical protein